MDREKLIDALEEIYRTDEFLRVEEALSKAAGGIDFDSLDDNDRQEGFYANFTDAQLKEALDTLKDDYRSAEERGASIRFTRKELRVLFEAMSDWSDPRFTRDRIQSRIAVNIRDKVDNALKEVNHEGE